MRLWSVKLSYLDTMGLLAVWREGLLAKKVLEGKTNGYKNHPQLDRFKSLDNPLIGINTYLNEVYLESVSRGYEFSKNKIDSSLISKDLRVPLNDEQLGYEFKFSFKLLLNNLVKPTEYLLYDLESGKILE